MSIKFQDIRAPHAIFMIKNISSKYISNISQKTAPVIETVSLKNFVADKNSFALLFSQIDTSLLSSFLFKLLHVMHGLLWAGSVVSIFWRVLRLSGVKISSAEVLVSCLLSSFWLSALSFNRMYLKQKKWIKAIVIIRFI